MANILERNKKLAQKKKTRQDFEEDALYREVWEDVNNEKTAAFMKKYWRYLIGGALVLMILVVGFQLIRMNRIQARMATATNYETAIANVDANALGAIGRNSAGATADLALFQSYMLDGNSSKLEELAKNGHTRDFRDLAKIHLATLNGDTMTAAEFEKFLGSVTTKKSPYYYNAMLLIAQKYIADGDKATGNVWLDKIINDKDAPGIISGTAQTLK